MKDTSLPRDPVAMVEWLENSSRSSQPMAKAGKTNSAGGSESYGNSSRFSHSSEGSTLAQNSSHPVSSPYCQAREEKEEDGSLSQWLARDTLAGESLAKAARVARAELSDCSNSSSNFSSFSQVAAKLARVERDFEERAAILEYDGGFTRSEAEARARAELGPGSRHEPLSWLAGLGRLSVGVDPCPGFLPGRWAKTLWAAITFVDEFGDQAVELNWSTVDLFGVHPVVGAVRADHSGALTLSGGTKVVAITSERICYGNGLTFYRRPRSEGSIPIWDFGSSRTADRD